MIDNTLGSLIDPSKWSLGLGCYLGVECVWHTCLFAYCLRYRPTLWLQKTSWGKPIIGKFRQRRALRAASGKSENTAFGDGARRFMETPWKRAGFEWFVMNKLAGLPLMPAKIALGASIARALNPEAKASAAESEKKADDTYPRQEEHQRRKPKDA